jgi:hypothetical protein
MIDNNPQPPSLAKSNDDAAEQPKGKNSDGCLATSFKIGFYILLFYLAHRFGFRVTTLYYWVFRVFIALVSAILLFIILNWISHLDEKSENFEGWVYNLWTVADETPIIKQLLKVAPLIAAPGQLFKSLLKKKSLVTGSVIVALVSINLEKPILSFLHLPPEEKTAAYIVYDADNIHFTNADSLFDSTESVTPMLSYIRGKYDLYINPLYNSSKSDDDRIRYSLIGAYDSRMAEKPQYEIFSEFYMEGISILQLILERELKTRTADDLAKLIKDAPPGVKRDYDLAIKEDSNESEWVDFKSNLIYVPFMLIIGGCCWLLQPVGRRNIRRCIAAGAYMVAALFLFDIAFFSMLASFNYLIIAEVFIWLLDLIYFEIWLLGFLPAILKTPRVRTFLAGNAIMVILQIVGYWYFRHLVNIS